MALKSVPNIKRNSSSYSPKRTLNGPKGTLIVKNCPKVGQNSLKKCTKYTPNWFKSVLKKIKNWFRFAPKRA